MFFRKKKQAEKPTAPTTQEVAPNGIKKMVYMGPTIHNNFRVVVFRNNGTHTHFYMTSRGDLYIPPKHTTETLNDPKGAWKEWNWAKNNWTQNNIPQEIRETRMWKNAMKALGQIANNNKTRKAVSQNNSKNERTTLGVLPGLAAAKDKLQQAEKEKLQQEEEIS